MQTYRQTVTGAQQLEFNVPGKYFTVLECTLPVDVALFKAGRKLDLGDVKGLMAGLEIILGEIGDTQPAFDKVIIKTTGADSIAIGIGNGQARYNRGNASVTVTQNKAPTSGAFANTQKTVTNATGQLLAANASRQYLLIQNKDLTGSIFVNFGAGAATTANGVRIPAGGVYELSEVVPTQAMQALGDIASNANITVVEG